MDIAVLKKEAEKISDPRRQYGNNRHKLENIIVIGILSILSRGEDYVDMEVFGIQKYEWLGTFLDLTNGIPDSDTFRRVYERLNPNELQECLNHWLASVRNPSKGEIINIDGKTIRGSGNKEHKAYHVVSAWVAENHITLGQIKTDEKSNEITAIPELLDLFDVKDSIVTIDAMGCQKAITERITEKAADYVINLKGNQPTLLNDVKQFFEDFSEFVPHYVTHEKGHGREETREYWLESNIGWLAGRNEWKNIHSIGMVSRTVEEHGESRTETGYYIASITAVEQFAYAVRKHWSIENQLHWCLDVVFNEDAARARKNNSPLNMNILRKTALTILKQTNIHRTSLRKKMFMAALNSDFLERLVFGIK